MFSFQETYCAYPLKIPSKTRIFPYWTLFHHINLSTGQRTIVIYRLKIRSIYSGLILSRGFFQGLSLSLKINLFRNKLTCPRGSPCCCAAVVKSWSRCSSSPRCRAWAPSGRSSWSSPSSHSTRTRWESSARIWPLCCLYCCCCC